MESFSSSTSDTAAVSSWAVFSFMLFLFFIWKIAFRNNRSWPEPEPEPEPFPEKYDVFLSFRGADTRDNFTGHLYTALKAKGILTYIDYRLERGEVISPSLLKAIEESKIAIVIFSENYANSTWCLEELVKIVDCMEKKGQTVIPVFYKVDPSDVDDQTGKFGAAFEKLGKCSTAKDMRIWRNALKKVANLSGWDSFVIRPEHELIKNITEDALEKLKQKASIYYAKGLVGIEPRVEDFKPRLSLESSDVKIVGIWGKDGLGKTTLARAVYDRIASVFEFRSKCFLPNTRETLQKHSLHQLQDELFKALLEPENLNSSTINLPLAFIKDRLRRKKVLIVVDDVDSSTQVKELLFTDEPDFFGPGSRILLTGRDKQVLMNVAGVNIYRMRELNDGEALQLFSMNAFKQENPPIDRASQSDWVVNYAKGNPRTLKGLGSALFNKSEKDWASTLETLQDIPNQRINGVLRTLESGLLSLEAYSYDILSWMLLISSFGGELKFENANLESLQQALRMMNPAPEAPTNKLSSPINLEVLWLKDCKGCKHLPPLDQIHSLKELYIDNLADLEYIHMMGNNDSTTFFPSLKKVWIWNCYYLKGWRKPKNDDETAPTSIAEMPWFPCLSLLEIKYCPNLSYMPLFPSLDERLYYVKSGIEPLLQTIKIKTVSTQLEGPQPQLFAKVKELWLSELEDLEYLDTERQRTSTVCPCLKKLWIYYCPKLKGWWKRGDDPTMTVAELPRFPCLSLLKVKYCPELSCMPLFPSLDDELYYVKTGIEPLLQTIKIKTMSSQIEGAQPQLFAKVKELWLSELEDLEYIDCEKTSWPRGLTACPSLKKLWIDYCPKLKGWWKRDYDAMKTTITELPQFPCLSLLIIKHCPNLSCMPLFPFLDEKLYYENVGKVPLEQTTIWLKMKSDKSTAGYAFSNIQALSICDVVGLEYIDNGADDNCFSTGSTVFPFLKDLWIRNCPDLKGWWKMTDTASDQLLPQFATLSMLDIRQCPNLSCMPLFPFVEQKLYYENVGKVPLEQTTIWLKMKSDQSTVGYAFSNIQTLSICDVVGLEYIDNGADDNCFSTGSTVFPFLKDLWIRKCPDLKGWWKRTDTASDQLLPQLLPQFATLSMLDIRECPNLSCMPLFPFVEKKLYYENVGKVPLEQTTIWLKMKSDQSTTGYAFRNIQTLSICDVVGLEYIDNGADDNCFSTGSTVFPFLKDLWIRNCPDLKGWWKRTEITSDQLPPQFATLSMLDIRECPNLSCLPLFPFVEKKLYYENVGKVPLEQTTIWLKMKSDQSTSGYAFRNIQTLSICDVVGLEYIDNGADDNCFSTGSTVFPFLKDLWIRNCPDLKGWWKRTDPAADQLLPQFATLSMLDIRQCPNLSCMPLFPFVEKKLYYENVGKVPLEQTTIWLKMKSDQSTAGYAFSKIQTLSICDVVGLEYIDNGSDDNCFSTGSTVFPFLTDLWIQNCPDLKGWWKRTDTAADQLLPQFATLSMLDVRQCPNLSCMPLFRTLEEKLHISGCPLLTKR